MSLLYKDSKDLIFEAQIEPRKDHENINILFSNDGGKFGTHELLDEFNLSPYELLKILQDHEAEKDEEQRKKNTIEFNELIKDGVLGYRNQEET